MIPGHDDGEGLKLALPLAQSAFSPLLSVASLKIAVSIATAAATPLPAFYLLSHRLEVALHSIDANRVAVDEQERLTSLSESVSTLDLGHRAWPTPSQLASSDIVFL